MVPFAPNYRKISTYERGIESSFEEKMLNRCILKAWEFQFNSNFCCLCFNSFEIYTRKVYSYTYRHKLLVWIRVHPLFLLWWRLGKLREKNNLTCYEKTGSTASQPGIYSWVLNILFFGIAHIRGHFYDHKTFILISCACNNFTN